MAFSPEDFLKESIFIDCRATLFYYESAVKGWRPCFSADEADEARGISRIQLVGQRSPSGNVCRILYGRKTPVSCTCKKVKPRTANYLKV